jgi:hypothetical protein
MVADMGTKKITVRVPEDLLEEVRAAAGPGGVSAYVTDALRRQRETDRLGELVDFLEEEFGPITDEEYAAGERELEEIDAEHKRLRVERRRDRRASRGSVA